MVALACDCLSDQVRRRAVFAAGQAFLQPDGARQLRILIDQRRRGGLSSRCCCRRRLPAARALPPPSPRGVLLTTLPIPRPIFLNLQVQGILRGQDELAKTVFASVRKAKVCRNACCSRRAVPFQGRE